MSSLVKTRSFTISSLLMLALLAACGEERLAEPVGLGLGQPISAEAIAAWDIDVGPDGVGLPAGSGSAQSGEPVYLAKCAACHGEFGEGMGRFPALVGEQASLVSDRPSKTVGSYWAHATTLWDYINRAMPFGNAQSLSPDEVYGITAYILYVNSIIADDTVLDEQSLLQVEMPNKAGFITASGTDIHAQACMHDCVDKVEVVSRASQSQVSTVKE